MRSHAVPEGRIVGAVAFSPLLAPHRPYGRH